MKAQHGASAAGGDLVACCPCSNIRCSGVDGIGRSFCSAAGRRCRQRHSIRIEFRSAGSDVHSRSHLSSAAAWSLDSGRLLVGFETLMAGVPLGGNGRCGRCCGSQWPVADRRHSAIPSLSAALKQVGGGC